jgi:XTP/dITP diphosphohydrolase
VKDIVFVTSNDNKLREVEAILGVRLVRENLDLDEIQEMDLTKIIEHKTKQAYKTLNSSVLVEDAGLYVDAWNGFPGPFIKWLASTMGYETFPKLLQENRKAEWIVMYGYYDGSSLHTFEGRIKGSIAPERRGENGWGFDPLFIPEGETQTYAEMGERKLHYSARQRALLKLKDYLQSGK